MLGGEVTSSLHGPVQSLPTTADIADLLGVAVGVSF